MLIQFNNCGSLILVFSSDWKNILLKQKNGKLDGFFTLYKTNDILEVESCKNIYTQSGLTLNPSELRIVTTLQNIEKKWKLDVYMILINDSEKSLETHNDLKLIDVNNIDSECHPNLKWLVPLSMDVSVFGSGFNQIIMK